jgi:outer membrane protein assembly factor BamB
MMDDRLWMTAYKADFVHHPTIPPSFPIRHQSSIIHHPFSPMPRITLLILCFLPLFSAADWKQFRGPNGASVSKANSPPEKWDDTENVAWKTELPGRGPSSPIVVGERVYVTCSSGARQDRLIVMCFDARSGETIWRREFWATGRTLTHPSSAVAAPTPASDGQRIFAFYSSNDLICLDLDGNLQWYRGLAFDYPKAGNDAGMASSPVVVGDTVVVQVESQGDAFAVGIDTSTGESRWRVDRDRVANWSSPIAFPQPIDGKLAVLLAGSQALVAIDARSGQELWKYETSCHSIASPAVDSNRIFVPSAGLTVLELGEGASTPSLLWQSNKVNPNQASPIVDGERVLAMNNAGVLTCAESKTGKLLWQLRVGGTHWSTPVLSGDLLYCLSQDGDARVIRIGADKGEVLHTIKVGETLQGSPAFADGALYFRSDRHLWKIAKK